MAEAVAAGGADRPGAASAGAERTPESGPRAALRVSGALRGAAARPQGQAGGAGRSGAGAEGGSRLQPNPAQPLACPASHPLSLLPSLPLSLPASSHRCPLEGGRSRPGRGLGEVLPGTGGGAGGSGMFPGTGGWTRTALNWPEGPFGGEVPSWGQRRPSRLQE